MVIVIFKGDLNDRCSTVTLCTIFITNSTPVNVEESI